jgi:hypothetical protein
MNKTKPIENNADENIIRKNTAAVNLYTDFPMPAYAFLPGINLHPYKNQEKTHLPKIPELNEQIGIKNWQKFQHYLYAIDLFNREYYWEVHEVLEDLWIKAGKNSETALFLKGIIQLAVVLLKAKTGNFYGAERLFNKALLLLQQKECIYLGIDIKKLIAEFQNYLRKETKNPPKIYLHGLGR